MNVRRKVAAVAAGACLIAGAAGLPAAHAYSKDGKCGGAAAYTWSSTSSKASTGVHSVGGAFYVDNRGILDNGVWLYQEGNGQDGLQRSTSAASVTGENDTCNDMQGATSPDTLLF